MRLYGLTWQGNFALGPRKPLRARRSLGAAVVAALSGLGVLAVWALAGSGAVAPAIGASLVGLGAWMWRSGIDVSLVKDTVRVTRRGLLGAETFNDPPAAYRGVLHTTTRYRLFRMVWIGRLYVPSFPSIHVQRIELVHRQGAWRVPVLQATGAAIPRRQWEKYAKLFGLPLLIEDGDRVLERAPEDLDKTLKELALADRLPGPTAGGPPPWPFRIDAGEMLIDVALRKPAFGWWSVGLAAGLPLMSLALAFVADPGMAGATPKAWKAWVYFATLLTPALYLAGIRRHITITRERVDWVLKFPFFNGRVTDSLRLADVEQVSVHKVRGDLRPSLLISGDNGSMSVARGLGRRHLAWLRDYLTAAIVTS